MTQFDYVWLAYTVAALVFIGSGMGLWLQKRRLDQLATRLGHNDK